MHSLAVVFAFSLVALSLGACEDSPPLVDDVTEDAAQLDAGTDAEDGD